MGMSIGGAVEALRSGEAVELDGFVYRYSESRRMLVVERNGVSSSVGSLTVTQIFAETWKVRGYEQEYRHVGQADEGAFDAASDQGVSNVTGSGASNGDRKSPHE